MYALSVTDLKQFYATPLGMLVAKALRRSANYFLNSKNETIMATGYPIPLLGNNDLSENEVVVTMPATLGALYWPASGNNIVCLAHEGELPIRENTINRALLLHSLEQTEELPHLMRELERVLTPSGRVIIFVPNRLSFWSHSSKSPFGYGRPFSVQQMKDLLNENGLTFLGANSSLFMPPTHMRFVHKMFEGFELLGKFFLPAFGGVLAIEASKQLYAGIQQPIKASRRFKPIYAPARAASMVDKNEA